MAGTMGESAGCRLDRTSVDKTIGSSLPPGSSCRLLGHRLVRSGRGAWIAATATGDAVAFAPDPPWTTEVCRMASCDSFIE